MVEWRHIPNGYCLCRRATRRCYILFYGLFNTISLSFPAKPIRLVGQNLKTWSSASRTFFPTCCQSGARRYSAESLFNHILPCPVHTKLSYKQIQVGNGFSTWDKNKEKKVRTPVSYIRTMMSQKRIILIGHLFPMKQKLLVNVVDLK